MLEALAAVQIPESELKQLKSISAVQTKGLKKHFHEVKFGKQERTKVASTVLDGNISINSLSGNKRKLRELLKEEETAEFSKKLRDYNIVGIDDSETSSDDEDSDTEEKELVNNEIMLVNSEKDILEITEVKVPTMKNDKVSTTSTKKETVVPTAEPVIRKPAVYIHVERDDEIQAARLKLPILSEEQIIMETISENSIIIIAGETGSGKTTQVPQFLYEAGYAENYMIGITEPRRVAAISMSKRVAREMNLSSEQVSYLIRFEGNCTPQTKIKFMTDGVLLKEIESDFMLNKYSVIILDEAHERSIYTDILIGLLSRIVLLRNKKAISPLKLIIMSATLRVKDFTENTKLFRTPPPVINVDSRQFPVTIHFNKVTAENYVREAYSKTIKIHTKLPEGGILIFLTGQQEVNYLVKKLRKAFPFRVESKPGRCILRAPSPTKIELPNYSDDEELEKMVNLKKAIKAAKKNKKRNVRHLALPHIDLDSYKLPGDDTEADLFEPEPEDGNLSDSDSEIDEELSKIDPINSQPLWVLPLYSLLTTDKQSRVFESPPEGSRLCVVSTNVAETSLTIPNIKYVIDAGRQKTKLYDKVTGCTAFVVTLTSKAAANQRAGRAGRTSEGHCYRLYSSAVYNDEFQDFSVPEIQQKPVDDLMLQMKCMGIDKVVNFPFPSPPDLEQLQMAEYRLKLINALEDSVVEKSGDNNGKTKRELLTSVTPLGRTISAFPVAPRFGKMLALSHQHKLLPYTICLVAALSVQEVLQEVSLTPADGKNNENIKWRNKRISWAGVGSSLQLGDPMILLRAVGGSEYAYTNGRLNEFCADNGIRKKAITEIRKLRVQLTNEINLNLPNLEICVDPNMPPPSDLQAKLLRQLMLSGMVDHVARKIAANELNIVKDRIKMKYAYNLPDIEEPVFIHSASVLRKKQPEWVVYQELYEVKIGDTMKTFIRGITAIEPEWLLQFATPLCNIGKPLEDPAPRYDRLEDVIYCHVKATFGKSGWDLPISEIAMKSNEQDTYRYFAKFLLDGEVFTELREYTKNLLSSANSMLKSWASVIPRTEILLQRLIQEEAHTKQRLTEIWQNNPKCK